MQGKPARALMTAGTISRLGVSKEMGGSKIGATRPNQGGDPHVPHRHAPGLARPRRRWRRRGLAAVTANPGPSPLAESFQPASFRFPKSAVEPPVAPAAPISLTASDGTGLALVALEANGVLEPPLAFTELRLTFENPRDETIEGRFRIALPPGAALSRFAMKIGGAWQEGEVVERQRARRAYEDFLHRRQDPALLEQEAGNEFSARVFPIPARGRKELIVSYSHALVRADQPYVIPLLGLSKVGHLDVRVLLGDRPAAGAAASNLGGEVSDRRVAELHKESWTPDRDFEIGQDAVADRPGLRRDNLAVVRVNAQVEAVPQEIAGLYILVDSSASRSLGYATQVRRIAELTAGLRDGAGEATPLGVAAFDQEVVSIFEGPASGFGAAAAQRLASRRPLGASDLDRALAWLTTRLAGAGRKYPRVLLVTDGIATAGETETRALKVAVHALGASGVERLDVLAVGGLRDEAVLRELTTGNLAHDGQRIDGAAPLSEIARRLTLACRSGVKVAVEGAAWVWPDTLDGVQPGDQALVYADLPADRPLRLSLDGRSVALGGELPAPAKPLLQRAWVQARMERLLHLRETVHAGDDDLRRALLREVAELSVENRVLSPYTALLVLETEDDYARFGLDRRALADILTVGPGGLEVLARQRSPLPRGDRMAPKPIAPRLPGNQPTDPIAVDEEAAAGRMDDAPSAMAAAPAPVEVPDAIVAGEADDAPLRISGSPPPPPIPAPELREEVLALRTEAEPEESHAAPYSGRFAEVMAHLAAGRTSQARTLAEAWHAEAPGDVLALLALGEVWEKAGETAAAARAYGSLIDLFPSRADLRRLAGERLERLGETGLELAIDTYRKAAQTGRTTPRATASSPGPCCAPAASRPPSRRWRRAWSNIIRMGASRASSRSSRTTWGCSRRPGCTPSRPGARRCSTDSRTTTPASPADPPCASSSVGRPTPTTSTSTSTTAAAGTPSTRSRSWPRAASWSPT